MMSSTLGDEPKTLELAGGFNSDFSVDLYFYVVLDELQTRCTCVCPGSSDCIHIAQDAGEAAAGCCTG